MGPLFSIILMGALGFGLSAVIFGIFSVANNRDHIHRSKRGMAAIALLTSAAFWVSGGLAGSLVSFLMSNHGTLESGAAVLTFFATSLLSGLLVAIAISRFGWKLISRG